MFIFINLFFFFIIKKELRKLVSKLLCLYFNLIIKSVKPTLAQVTASYSNRNPPSFVWGVYKIRDYIFWNIFIWIQKEYLKLHYSTTLFNQYCTVSILCLLPIFPRPKYIVQTDLPFCLHLFTFVVHQREESSGQGCQGIQLHHNLHHQLCVAGENQGNCWQRSECLSASLYQFSVFTDCRSQYCSR